MSNLAQIHLLGTGGGYGESLVINLGNDEWIVVDSCQNPKSLETLPLSFLQKLGINLNQVKLILCTHWHDDHIRGLSTLLERCPNALFSFARITDIKKFLRLVGKDDEKQKYTATTSSTIEFNKCIDILSSRRSQIKYASNDKLLYSSTLGELKCEVYSLSPSDRSSEIFDEEIASLIEMPSNRKLIIQTPNDKSVVLLLKLGHHSVLLGADLEVHHDVNLGWMDIINNSSIVRMSQSSSYFKIPHHGSENGYHSDIWDLLLVKEPIASLTPWKKKMELPTDEMLNLYSGISSELYITSRQNVSEKMKKRENSVAKVINRFNDTLQEVKFNFGIISSQIDINNKEAKWETEVFNSAIKLK